ncbi:ATP-binding protein [Thiomicrorhabdus sp.]|uniref:ATP-binding protein n=1 Tax=Thiomicrorhabdus sp. TaxID=2039724 RepID=UPI002AA63E6A|nr:ATP-binding protein [Thiomicrorhabdus sp.]
MHQFQQQVQDLYLSLPVATALFERDEDGIWQRLWQNPAAHSLWGDFNLAQNPRFKLELMDSLSQIAPSFFDYQVPGAIETFRFIATPYKESVLVQFLASTKEKSYSETVTEKSSDINSLIIDSAKFGIYDWNLEKDFIQFNQKGYEVFGVSGSDIGSTYERLFSRVYVKDQETVANAIEDHLVHKWPLNIEFRMLNIHDQYEWINMTGQAIWKEGKAVRLAGVLHNISDRKYAETQLKQREILIEQMIDVLPISIYVKDAQGCYRFFNKKAETISGRLKGQVIGRTDFEVFPIEIASIQASKDKEIQSSEKVVVYEKEVTVNDQVLWMYHGKSPMHVKQLDGSYETWLLSFSLDITKRKQAEEELKTAHNIAEQAAKAKSDFLSVMSHEIRTPLNAVIGNASLLLSEDLDEYLAKHIEMIKRSGDHLLYLINDILDFNKLEAGKVELEQKPFNMLQQIKTVVEMSVINAKLKHIGLDFTIADNVKPYYLGDEGRLRQILLNLVGNAIKFTSEGEVQIRLIKAPNSSFSKSSQSVGQTVLRFEVTDTGIGISEENIPKLFTEFAQADASTSRKFGGTGLGLSISKKLVEAMGGQIGILSEEGVGSTFWFEVPFEEAPEFEVTSEQIAQPQSKVKPLKILVAEDNESNQFLVKTILTKLGHSVEIANNGLEAFEMVQENDACFDLVLMDMQMPELSGIEATQQIRMLDSSVSHIPIIALSANSYEEGSEAVLAAGMNDYLSKPIDIGALKAALQKWS